MYPKVSDRAKDSAPQTRGQASATHPREGTTEGGDVGVAGGRMGWDVGKLRVWAGDLPQKWTEHWNWEGSDRRKTERWMCVVGDRRKAEQWMLATVC